MSIVEKAVEKLKTRQPEPPPRPDEAAPVAPVLAPTVERSQEQVHAVEVPDEAAPPWHLDLDNLRRSGLVPGEAEAERRLTDELRRVKRPLLNNMAAGEAGAIAHAERIVVTSAVPGEGKTFTAMNLALSLAREPDFEVLLVDGDIPKANVTRALGLEGRPGLMDVLIHPQLRPADVIVPVDVPNLLVVPTGERHSLTAELLGGRRMTQVLEAWSGGRHRQRLLVFDSPPLLATSEAQVLTSHMGQVVMIVAAGRTRRQEVRIAMQAMGDSQYVGLVLNMSRLPPSESHYYDSYYSNYYSSNRRGEA